uniref:Uncharacterized protein n=1 Tax=Noctiluca scintillans TaxID=2966 RepID=A0A7S1AFP9_NOCSC|eukprot:CAMPEP_0194538400 /NCGR_PEP_ID=MMETSP0253-20130528/77919_1 /TAXON_ID=2966 /ORGANISM="Noctiluca scintillans" /LENGTH=1063 /DNA_ID=CAMNT_0039384517 /DNA_START=75 /DNA_END=3266 /DNA_ORIENTATION=+
MQPGCTPIDECSTPLFDDWDAQRTAAALNRGLTFHGFGATREYRRRPPLDSKRSFDVNVPSGATSSEVVDNILVSKYHVEHDMRALQVQVLQDVAQRHAQLILRHTGSTVPRRRTKPHPLSRMLTHLARRGMLQDDVPAQLERQVQKKSTDLFLRSPLHSLAVRDFGARLLTVTTYTEHRLYKYDAVKFESLDKTDAVKFEDDESCKLSSALFGEEAAEDQVDHQVLQVLDVVDPNTFVVEVPNHDGTVWRDGAVEVKDATITTQLNMYKLVPEVIMPLTTIVEVVLPIQGLQDVRELLNALPPEPKPMTLTHSVELLHLSGVKRLTKGLSIHGRLRADGHVRRAYWTKGIPLFTNSWLGTLGQPCTNCDREIGFRFQAVRNFSIISLGRQVVDDIGDTVQVSLWSCETRERLASVVVGPLSPRENDYAFESVKDRVWIRCGKGYALSFRCRGTMMDKWYEDVAEKFEVRSHMTPELVENLEGWHCEGEGYPNVSNGLLKQAGMLNFKMQWGRCGPPLGFAEAETFATRDQVKNLQDGDWIVLRQGVSYAELLKKTSPARQGYPIKDFISHTWGEPTTDFLKSLQRARCRSCWVCPFAVNQHEVDLEDDLKNTPFYKALDSVKKASGRVLMVLDEDATPLSRIWCVYEIFVTAQLGLRFEMATSQGLMNLGPSWKNNLQRKINSFKLDEAVATVEADRIKILQEIRGNRSPAEADIQVERLVLRVVSQNATFGLYRRLTESEEVLFAIPWFAYWGQKVLEFIVRGSVSIDLVVGLVIGIVAVHEVYSFIKFPHWGRVANWRKSQSKGLLFFTAYSLVQCALMITVAMSFILDLIDFPKSVISQLVDKGVFRETTSCLFTVYVCLRMLPWALLVAVQTATPFVHYGGFDGHVYYQAAPRFGFATACVCIAINSDYSKNTETYIPGLRMLIQANIVTWIVALLANLVTRFSTQIISGSCRRLLGFVTAATFIIVTLVCATFLHLYDSPDARVGLCGMALFLLSRLWMVLVFDMRPVWYDMRRRGGNFLVTYLPVFLVRRRDSSASCPRYLGSTGTYDVDSFESAL